jgi:hypothetical protein
MPEDYWVKQAEDKPIFEDILWSRPENRASAGRLLIVGGNAHGFAAPAEAYQAAVKAGIGTGRVLLPDVLQKTVGPVLENVEFAPSTPSGSFGKSALNEMLIQASWAEAVLLAGELGRNSETAALLELFVSKYSGQLTITRDAVDYFNHVPLSVAQRPETTLVLSLGQLQKLGTVLHFETPFLLSMGLLLLVQALHSFTLQYPVTKELENIVVAQGGRVSTTRLAEDKPIWRVETAARTSVFWLQNPGKPYEAMVTSLTNL